MSKPPPERGEAIASAGYNKPSAAAVVSVGFFGIVLTWGALEHAFVLGVTIGAAGGLVLLLGNITLRLSIGHDWICARFVDGSLWVDTARLKSITVQTARRGPRRVRFEDDAGRHVIYRADEFFEPSIAAALHPMLARYRREPGDRFDHHFLDQVAKAAKTTESTRAGSAPGMPALPPPGHAPAIVEHDQNLLWAGLGAFAFYTAAAMFLGAVLHHFLPVTIAGAAIAAACVAYRVRAHKPMRLSVGPDWAASKILTTHWVDLTQLTRLAVRRTRLGTLMLYLDDNAGRGLRFPVRPCLTPAVAAALTGPLEPYRHASPHAFDQPFLARLAEAATKARPDASVSL